jgi:type I restriction enzyme S subunit
LFPDAPQRKAIGVILDTLDEAILATGQLISKLDLLKRGLLYDLLTRGIDENGELRDGEKLQHSPIGAIPKAWQAMAVGEVASHVTSGSRDWAGYYAEDGPLFLRIGNLTREHVNLRLEDVVHVQPPASGEGKRTRLIEGDVLLSITADLGIVGVVPAALGEAYVNQHIAVVRIKRHLANPRWIGLYLSGEAAQAQVRRFDDPGAKAGLNLPTVRSLVLPLPPMREQEKIVARIDAADIAVAAERDYLTKLQLLRVGLREALVTGRVPVTALVGDTAA